MKEFSLFHTSYQECIGYLYFIIGYSHGHFEFELTWAYLDLDFSFFYYPFVYYFC